MLYRTWPYGTVKRVTVMQVTTVKGAIIVVCTDLNDPKEAYVCLFRADQVAAKEGEDGLLTFTQGGPTGGYWKYSAAFKDVDAVRV